MRLSTKSSKIILSLLCVLVCLSFAACNDGAGGEKDAPQVQNPSSEAAPTEDTSSGNISPDLLVKEADISLPEDITMELFGVNLLKMNRPSWEEHIYTLKETEEDTTVYMSFSFGDYIVTHTRRGFQNAGNLSSFIQYKDVMTCAHMQFDANDNLSRIEMAEDLGKEFSTSFLRIGDNPKEYLESLKPGAWDRLLGGELLTTKQGWFMYYNGDSLHVSTLDILLSYLLKDELVDYIMVSVIGEPPQKNEIPLESGIYALDRFDYFMDGKDIAKMSMSEWVNLFDFSQNGAYKKMLMNITDTSKKYIEEHGPVYCYTKMVGKNVEAYLSYSENSESKWLGISMEPMEGEKSSDNHCSISFSINERGNIQMSMDVRGKFPMITSNFIVPGDNIRTFLNSYEEGLYEKIVSLEYDEILSIGPYEFMYNGEAGQDSISIRKKDERMMDSIGINFENEIVTDVHRTYTGIISGYEEELSLN